MEALVPAVRQAASMHLLVVKILRLLLLEEEMRGLLVPLMNGVPRLQQRQSVEEVKMAGRVLHVLYCASCKGPWYISTAILRAGLTDGGEEQLLLL